MSVVAIIPARMDSTRFPGKALADDTGKAMVVHVCERASLAQSVLRVVVATDSLAIFDVVTRAGFEGVMTSVEHPNGTSRLGEAAKVLGLDESDVVINVQGDEPEIEPSVIDGAYGAYCGDAGGDARSVGTVVTPIVDNADFLDPNIVKAVMSGRSVGGGGVEMGRALYFSRSGVPYPRVQTQTPAYRHVGIYAYRVGAIWEYLSWDPTDLEITESLEQLRWLGHGYSIRAAYCRSMHSGIDTPEQYRAFVGRFKA